MAGERQQAVRACAAARRSDRHVRAGSGACGRAGTDHTPAPSTPAAAPFGGQEDFVANIPIKSGNLALEIRVTGDKARAYACDNEGIETWLSGSAANGVLKLGSADKVSQLDGRHQGNTVVGSLRIGEMSWDFTAVPGETSAF